MNNRCENCPVSLNEICLQTENSITYAWMCERAKLKNDHINKNIIYTCKATIAMRKSNPAPTKQEINLFYKEIQLLRDCKYRSKKIVTRNENNVEVIVHEITNEDGSKSIYSDCGCGMWRCAKGKGNQEGYVTQNDCRKCIQELILKEGTRQPGLGDFPNQAAGIGIQNDSGSV